MRILFDLLIAEQQGSNGLVSIREMLSIIASSSQEHEYILVTGRPKDYGKQADIPNVRVYPLKLPSKNGGLLSHQLRFPSVLHRLRPDVLHVPDGIALIGWHGPLIISIHDALWLEEPDPSLQYYRRYLFRESIQRAHAILVPSEQIYTMLVSTWSIEKQRVQLISEKADRKIIPQIYQAICQGKQLSTLLTDRTQSRLPLNDSSLPTTQERDHLPSVSIIIPVSRPVKVEKVLRSISKQRYVGKYETIIVGPSVEAIARRWSVRAVNTRLLEKPGRSRNLGATHARGNILLFLDDDIMVAEDWIVRNVRALQRPGIGVVGARVVGKSDAFFARCVDFTNFGHYQHRRPHNGPVASASMGVHKVLFQRIDGFDETLSSGEDIDFCHRIHRQSYHTCYRPEITVIHDHQRDTLGALLHYNYAHGLASGLTTKIHHRNSGLKNFLLYHARFPPLFLLLLPIIAFIAALHIVVINIRYHKRVLLYAPFILLGKLAYEYGVLVRLLKD
ncbi:MAG TPA: glycosyltransferase [Ktedonobacteraceae bacterium]|nr:glycosyltransferase [Ktedonobacteraceae bacterium]